MVKTAADVTHRRVGELEAGQAMVFESTNEQNDLPHQILSSWEFGFFLNDESDGCYEFTGTASIRVEIVRGLEIPLYPGHPDRWGGAQEIILIDEAPDVFIHVGPTDAGSACLSGPVGEARCLWDPHRVANGTVGPFNAQVVEVVLENRATAPLPIDFGYHDASTREVLWPDPIEEAGGRAVYRLDVGGGDGPYARQSQWEFWVIPERGAFYTGSYAMTATAFRTG